MRTNNRRLSLLVVLGLLMAACGGGGDVTSTTTTAPPGSTTTGAAPTTTPTTEAGVQFDVGVTEDTITVGLLADLTGIFSPLVQDIVAAQEVYWDLVNEAGGIAGRQIELNIQDTGYNPDQHRTLYEGMRDQVAII
ncbi:MAG: ABC transporter substrate-binding protein, partial [Acidimicrobiia bacterium]|nr:ABC transporter substrate-binding protein [Acidimicrobiia bacterium]